MKETLVHAAVLIFATIDPIGTLALFAAITPHLSELERRQTAIRATVLSAIVLLASLILGQILLDAMGVHLVSMQVAGGLILFVFGMQMIFSSSSSTKPESGRDLAVFPLAVPSIASPGAILAVILMTDNDVYSVKEQVFVGLVLLGVLAFTLMAMLLATPILRVIGRTGASLLVRVMGMLLAAVAVELVMTALGVEKWVGAGAP